MRAFRFSRSVSTVAATLLAYAAPLPAQQVTADALKPLTFRHIGPVGNRVASVSGVVGDPLTYYAGAATGGVWKSTDGGIVWRPVFDKQDVSAAGKQVQSALGAANWHDKQKASFETRYLELQKAIDRFMSGEIQTMVKSLNELARRLDDIRSMRM